MSAVISDAAFERDMRALHMRLGELCHYGKWHKEDPTMPLIEMIRIMTKAREEAELEATKRAIEDWAWEEEEALRREEAEKPLIPCEFCGAAQEDSVCSSCTAIWERYGAGRCEYCLASYKGLVVGDWDNPCESCHPQFIADYRRAEEEWAQEANADSEVAAWYRALPLFAEEEG